MKVKTKMKRCRPLSFRILAPVRRLLASVLIGTLLPATSLFAQTAAVGQAVASTPMSLHITILDGEDALNSIRERTAREPIVEVDDENHKPVAGALILFTIDNSSGGAGGTFSGASQTLSVTTDAQGRAVAHGLLPNQTPGKYTISVSATVGTLVATAVIHQSNIAGLAPAASTSSVAASQENVGTVSRTSFGSRLAHIPKKYWAVGGGIVVVGTVLGVTLANSKSSTTITPGTGTVGP